MDACQGLCSYQILYIVSILKTAITNHCLDLYSNLIYDFIVHLNVGLLDQEVQQSEDLHER